MERIQDERLRKLQEQGFSIYSISRLNCIDQCPYQAYQRYILGKTEEPSIWGTLGGKVHDALQKCIDTGCQEKVINEAIYDELDNLGIMGLDFPSDRNGRSTIRDNWIANMTRFADEFRTPKGKFETEQLVLLPVNDHAYMQGYIDLIKHNDDGTISIIDWKTSSQFTKEHLVSAGRQLILYGLAKRMEGYEVSKLCWVMLKYCETSWELKNGSVRKKVSEWRNLVKDLQPALEKKLKEAGIDGIDAECLIQDAKERNSLDCLPDSVKSQFKTKIYVREYPFSQENIDETLEYIKAKIEQYEKGGDDERNYPPCDIKKESYFCSSLCGFSKSCVHYADYCSQFMKKEEEDAGEDLF